MAFPPAASCKAIACACFCRVNVRSSHGWLLYLLLPLGVFKFVYVSCSSSSFMPRIIFFLRTSIGLKIQGLMQVGEMLPGDLSFTGAAVERYSFCLYFRAPRQRFCGQVLHVCIGPERRTLWFIPEVPTRAVVEFSDHLQCWHLVTFRMPWTLLLAFVAEQLVDVLCPERAELHRGSVTWGPKATSICRWRWPWLTCLCPIFAVCGEIFSISCLRSSSALSLASPNGKLPETSFLIFFKI